MKFTGAVELTIWKDVVLAVCSSSNATNVRAAIYWADEVLKAIRERDTE